MNSISIAPPNLHSLPTQRSSDLDVGKAIIKVLESPIEKVQKQVFNVGSNSENYTITALANLTAKVFPDCRVQVNKSLSDERNYRVDFGKIKSV